MSSFNEREKGFENKFTHDQETAFKVAARRNKLLGLWAAEQMGLADNQADAYAREVISADLQEAGEEDVYRKIAGDFAAKGVDASEHRIRREMAAMLDLARDQILAAKTKK
jgi:hypothetical protein